uniref:Potassium calcium-activated channel subfamily M regulatory beta subunit 4 n=1 Tax=Ornithorhynchus anatinus TaxID=9258 RepID=A0A6I8NHX2_ORNAN
MHARMQGRVGGGGCVCVHEYSSWQMSPPGWQPAAFLREGRREDEREKPERDEAGRKGKGTQAGGEGEEEFCFQNSSSSSCPSPLPSLRFRASCFQFSPGSRVLIPPRPSHRSSSWGWGGRRNALGRAPARRSAGRSKPSGPRRRDGEVRGVRRSAPHRTAPLRTQQSRRARDPGDPTDPSIGLGSPSPREGTPFFFLLLLPFSSSSSSPPTLLLFFLFSSHSPLPPPLAIASNSSSSSSSPAPPVPLLFLLLSCFPRPSPLPPLLFCFPCPSPLPPLLLPPSLSSSSPSPLPPLLLPRPSPLPSLLFLLLPCSPRPSPLPPPPLLPPSLSSSSSSSRRFPPPLLFLPSDSSSSSAAAAAAGRSCRRLAELGVLGVRRWGGGGGGGGRVVAPRGAMAKMRVAYEYTEAEDKSIRLGLLLIISGITSLFVFGFCWLSPALQDLQAKAANCTVLSVQLIGEAFQCTFTCGTDCRGTAHYPCLQVFVNNSHSNSRALLHRDEHQLLTNPKCSYIPPCERENQKNSESVLHWQQYWKDEIGSQPFTCYFNQYQSPWSAERTTVAPPETHLSQNAPLSMDSRSGSGSREFSWQKYGGGLPSPPSAP